jgi:peptidyl-prolyl cis-trans isomerase SurA
MKRLIPIILFLFATQHTKAQTLLTYGNKQVSKKEFLNAFHKNNTETPDYKSAVTDYLELYTRFKLKVQAAYDAKMDTLPNQKSDILGFRKQIEEPYMTDTVELKRLVEEAYQRSQKEIGLSHIFIPYRSDFGTNPFSLNPISKDDSLSSLKKMQEVSSRLKAGTRFEDVARDYSADKATSVSGGKLGYVTVFTLPYEMENVVYRLTDQQVSDPVISPRGYHFFKKTGDQPARGRIKVAQILIAFEPQVTASQKAASLKLADSLYTAIINGGNFEELARKFSNDKLTLATGGVMPEFGIGQYEPAFEDKAFALQAKGDVSRPFETSFGYHIVKKIDGIPVEKDPKLAYPFLKSAVEEDARSKIASKSFEKQVLQKVPIKKTVYDASALWRMTDSFVYKNKKISVGALNSTSTLFSFPKKKVTVKDWLEYAQGNALEGKEGNYPAQMKQFITASSVLYYREHLEEYNADFRAQLQEFADGNLLFEVMEKRVWNKAATDTAGLRNYYEKHKSQYQWGPSVSAIIFNTSDKRSAEEAQRSLQQNPAGWRVLMESSGGRIAGDSGRFDIAQITDKDSDKLKAGYLSPIVENETDKSASFYYIVNVYTKTSPRNFDESRGIVMNDYQLELEEKWIAELKKKYPVKVNQPVWNEVRSAK